MSYGLLWLALVLNCLDSLICSYCDDFVITQLPTCQCSLGTEPGLFSLVVPGRVELPTSTLSV